MNRKNFLWLVAVSIAFNFSLAACGGQPTASAQNLTLRARDIVFDVTALHVKADQPVNLTYVNDGVIDHAFAIEGLVKEQKVKPGQKVAFTFTPTTSGAFKYYCAIAGHEAMGMVGMLTVTP